MDWKEEFRNALLDMTQNPPDVRKIVKPHIPKKLFKYGSFQSEYWKQTIYKAEIFLSPAKVFNDPFDCRANFNYEKAIAVGKFRDELIKQYGKSWTEKVIEGMREDVFVFCFSEVWNSLLMWAHYANNYNGYCIEYDMGQVRDYLIHNLYPVLYEKDYIDITNNLINTNQNTGLICNLAKAEEWSYEKEWRIVEYQKNKLELEINKVGLDSGYDTIEIKKYFEENDIFGVIAYRRFQQGTTKIRRYEFEYIKEEYKKL